MSYLKRIATGLTSLAAGMAVTWRHLFRKPVTEIYPHREPTLSPHYRAAIALRTDEVSGTHVCTACMACVKICPSFCITVEGVRHEGVKGKRASEFLVDYSLCSLCGLCIDSCGVDALEYSKIYDVTGYRRDDFVFDLLEPFREKEAAYIGSKRAEAAAKEQERARAAEKKAAAAKQESTVAKDPARESAGSTSPGPNPEKHRTTEKPGATEPAREGRKEKEAATTGREETGAAARERPGTAGDENAAVGRNEEAHASSGRGGTGEDDPAG
jgi:formate hydrogenlyase subunit 6/NADH:ubiquinone oxidoreductase subunit I